MAHRVQKYARIAADFGLRSFEVLGFGRATRLVSAMPVLILRLGRRMCGSATKERFVQPFGVAQFCPRGHKWSFGGNEKGYQHLMCSSKLPVQMSGDDEEEEYPTKQSFWGEQFGR